MSNLDDPVYSGSSISSDVFKCTLNQVHMASWVSVYRFCRSAMWTQIWTIRLTSNTTGGGKVAGAGFFPLDGPFLLVGPFVGPFDLALFFWSLRLGKT